MIIDEDSRNLDLLLEYSLMLKNGQAKNEIWHREEDFSGTQRLQGG